MLDSKLDQKFPKSKKNLNDLFIFALFRSRKCGIVVEHHSGNVDILGSNTGNFCEHFSCYEEFRGRGFNSNLCFDTFLVRRGIEPTTLEILLST